MSTEGRSSEARRPRGGGRNKSWSSRDGANSGGTSSTPTVTRRNSQRGPGKQEFFTDSTNTSYIPSPSPARPAGRPRQAVGSIGGGKSFKAALQAALNNNGAKGRENGSLSSPKPHRRAESTPSVPTLASVSRKSPVQVSELGSPTPNTLPTTTATTTTYPARRGGARTPSPTRRTQDIPYLVSPASFISESSEPPQALPEIYRRIEDEELIAEQGNTDDDLSGSVRTSPDTRRKRISASPSGLSNSIPQLSLQGGEEQEEEKEAARADPEPELDNEPKSILEPRLASSPVLKPEKQASAELEIKSDGSGESSPFEEIVETDPEMLARDEKRVKELIKNDLKAFAKADRAKTSLTVENLRRQNARSGSTASSSSRSISSGKVSEPNLNIPTGWGRKARNNARWMEKIAENRDGAGANLSSAEATGESVAQEGGSASKSISSWLQTAAATPLPEAPDSLQSTPAANNAGGISTPDRQPFSKAKLWESQNREASLSPGRQNVALAALRERSMERLEKSAVATSRLNALGQARSSEKLVRRTTSETDFNPTETAELDVRLKQQDMSTIDASLRSSSEPVLQHVPSSEVLHDGKHKATSRTSVASSPRLLSDTRQGKFDVDTDPEHSKDAVLPLELDQRNARGESALPIRSSASVALARATDKSRPQSSGGGGKTASTDGAKPNSEAGSGSDSHDLLRRFARASSSSPAPSRSSRPETRDSDRSSKPDSPKLSAGHTANDIGHSLSKHKDIAASSDYVVIPSIEAPSLPPDPQDTQPRPESPTRTQHASKIPTRQSGSSGTPAVKVGNTYLKTPKVTGAWVDTPAAAKSLDIIHEDEHGVDEYNVDSLLDAAKAATGGNETKTKGSRSAAELEALRKTAPELPPSALAAIIEHAKKKNRGEEGPEGEETLQLDESTIHSLEELLAKNDNEFEDETVEGKQKEEKTRKAEEPVESVAPTIPLEGEKKGTSSNPIAEGFSRLKTALSSSKKHEDKNEEIQEKLRTLPAPPSEDPQKTSKSQQQPSSASTSSASQRRDSRQPLTISIEDSPKQRSKNPKKGVAVVAPDEECDQAGEFHDFIWPCEACRRRAKNAIQTEDDMVGVVQWQTVQVPRLWRWPTLRELYGEGKDQRSANAWQRLQTWIPRLTLLGWIVLVVGSYAIAENEVTKAYTPPFYADTMVGYGVDAYAPRPPFVLTKYIWRSPFGGIFRSIWLAICVVVRAVTGLLGFSAGVFGHGGKGVTAPASTKRWVFQEAWEPAIDVGRGVPEVGLGQDDAWL